jgi:hypothetical protein
MRRTTASGTAGGRPSLTPLTFFAQASLWCADRSAAARTARGPAAWRVGSGSDPSALDIREPHRRTTTGQQREADDRRADWSFGQEPARQPEPNSAACDARGRRGQRRGKAGMAGRGDSEGSDEQHQQQGWATDRPGRAGNARRIPPFCSRTNSGRRVARSLLVCESPPRAGSSGGRALRSWRGDEDPTLPPLSAHGSRGYRLAGREFDADAGLLA